MQKNAIFSKTKQFTDICSNPDVSTCGDPPTIHGPTATPLRCHYGDREMLCHDVSIVHTIVLHVSYDEQRLLVRLLKFASSSHPAGVTDMPLEASGLAWTSVQYSSMRLYASGHGFYGSVAK